MDTNALGLIGGGFLLLGASYLLGVLLAPLLDRWWVASRKIATDKHNIAHNKQMIETRKQLDLKNREASKSRDIRIDELLTANQIDDARQLAEEKLRSAHEQDNKTLVQLYKQYLAEIESAENKADR